MSPLTALVVILALGSLNCLEFESTDPEIRKLCKKRAGVGNKNLRNLKDKNVRCYYHCKYEQEGIIVNGTYVGDNENCLGVKDGNICELARLVVICNMLRGNN